MSDSSALPLSLQSPIDILLIDNFDSFTWNLYQSLCLIAPEKNLVVIRNDAISPDQLKLLQIQYLVISPGPGHPQTDSGISRDAIKYFAGKVPILGVCMGLECLVDVYGGQIAYAGEIMHGKVSNVRHDGRGIFKSLPQNFPSTRYHSLSASLSTLPPTLAVTAVTAESGVIMAVRHREFTLEAVQYHPESILSEQGDEIMVNFLKLDGGKWEDNQASGVLDPALPPFDIKALDGTAHASNPAAVAKIPTILEKIYAQRIADVAAAKATPGTTPADLSTLLSLNLAPPPIALVRRLKAGKGTALMAEIKRASPSKGPIAMSANAAEQALTYALAGASVISVLTEPTWFKGSLLDMRMAREAIASLPNRPAVLRKDFILDEYQIAEARLHGADTVLLIVAMLPPARLRTLYAYSLGLGMEPLVEVNNATEMALALELGAQVIGVNNRNLHDFQVDMATTSRLVDMVKERDVVLCALSGISSPSDVKTYSEQGVSAVLIGEALMRAPDPKVFIRELLSWPEPTPKPSFPPLVKICGITTSADALAAADAGADMLGLMFTPASKRCLSLEAAQKIAQDVRASHAEPPPAPAALEADEPENDTWFAAHAHRLSTSLSRSPKRPLLVGVFQNQPLSQILAAVSAAQLDLVQLHGSEPVEIARHIPVPVIKVFHIDPDGNGLEGVTRPGLHEFVLLDATNPNNQDGFSGGSGTPVNRSVAAEVVAAGELQSKKQPQTNGAAAVNGPQVPMPIILAGGLTPGNVREAIEAVRPWAVDVSGGVEGENGKDPEKIKAFINAAKGL
ncbi:hypothetical protein HWV62_36422 [Athelia sp. TMB]|nr:hypothetical protein HWV62_36422 [Athelia sp. TMB]